MDQRQQQRFNNTGDGEMSVDFANDDGGDDGFQPSIPRRNNNRNNNNNQQFDDGGGDDGFQPSIPRRNNTRNNNNNQQYDDGGDDGFQPTNRGRNNFQKNNRGRGGGGGSGGRGGFQQQRQQNNNSEKKKYEKAKYLGDARITPQCVTVDQLSQYRVIFPPHVSEMDTVGKKGKISKRATLYVEHIEKGTKHTLDIDELDVNLAYGISKHVNDKDGRVKYDGVMYLTEGEHTTKKMLDDMNTLIAWLYDQNFEPWAVSTNPSHCTKTAGISIVKLREDNEYHPHFLTKEDDNNNDEKEGGGSDKKKKKRQYDEDEEAEVEADDDDDESVKEPTKKKAKKLDEEMDVDGTASTAAAATNEGGENDDLAAAVPPKKAKPKKTKEEELAELKRRCKPAKIKFKFGVASTPEEINEVLSEYERYLQNKSDPRYNSRIRIQMQPPCRNEETDEIFRCQCTQFAEGKFANPWEYVVEEEDEENGQTQKGIDNSLQANIRLRVSTLWFSPSTNRFSISLYVSLIRIKKRVEHNCLTDEQLAQTLETASERAIRLEREAKEAAAREAAEAAEAQRLEQEKIANEAAQKAAEEEAQRLEQERIAKEAAQKLEAELACKLEAAAKKAAEEEAARVLIQEEALRKQQEFAEALARREQEWKQQQEAMQRQLEEYRNRLEAAPLSTKEPCLKEEILLKEETKEDIPKEEIPKEPKEEEEFEASQVLTPHQETNNAAIDRIDDDDDQQSTQPALSQKRIQIESHDDNKINNPVQVEVVEQPLDLGTPLDD